MLISADCFLLGLLMSPGAWRPKSLIAVASEYNRTHRPEASVALDNERARVRSFRYLLCISAIVVLVVIVLYAWYRKL
jgi:hypothetical protein